jgi:hypothetical protein
MKTDLAEIFNELASKQRDGFHFFNTTPGDFTSSFAKYTAALRQSRAGKISAFSMSPSDFWSITALDVVLSDVTLISGYGGAHPFMLANADTVLSGLRDDSNQSSDILERTDDHVAVRALMFCDQEMLQRWAQDAEPFIRDGRVMYSPTKCVTKFVRDPEGAKSRNEPVIQAVALPDDAEWTSAAAMLQAIRDHSVELHLAEHEPLAEKAALLELTVPYITNITLRKLYKLVEAEGDTLASFRAAFAQAIPQYRQALASLGHMSHHKS